LRAPPLLEPPAFLEESFERFAIQPDRISLQRVARAGRHYAASDSDRAELLTQEVGGDLQSVAPSSLVRVRPKAFDQVLAVHRLATAGDKHLQQRERLLAMPSIRRQSAAVHREAEAAQGVNPQPAVRTRKGCCLAPLVQEDYGGCV
jgi:hypothetical protein